MRSFVGRPKIHVAGDDFVAGLGVFLYCKTAFRRASTMLMSPSFPVLPVMSCLMVLTPISALQLLCGKAIELLERVFSKLLVSLDG